MQCWRRGEHPAQKSVIVGVTDEPTTSCGTRSLLVGATEEVTFLGIGISAPEAAMVHVSPLKEAPIVLGVNTGLIGEAKGGSIRLPGVIEVDAVMAAHGFHGDLEGDGLRVQVPRRVSAAR